MEVEEIHNHTNAARSGSLSRMVTGMPASRILKRRGQHQNDDEDDDDDEDDGGGRVEVRTNVGGRDFESNDFDNNDNNNSSSSDKKNQLVAWPNASRIIRVSRVSGCKDRHSKVLTSRGLRDRRIRLSVTTAIRFYELQDRLGYDQPSKAVEWLIKAAADPIADLPSLNNSFPATPSTQETDLDCSFQQQQHLATLSKSSAPAAALCTCSGTSNASISKGSGLSLSRTDVRLNRGKARERERASKDNHSECNNNNNNKNSVAASPNSHNNDSNASFTGPLAGAASAVHHFDSFNSGLFLQPRPNNSSGFFGQMQLGNPFPFNVGGGGEQQSELQHFSVVPDHLIPVSSAQSQAGSGSGDSSLNFTVSPGSCGGRGLSAGFNRGTLQSNSPPVWTPHMTQRLTTADGPSNFPLFLGGATATPVEGHSHTRHHHPFSSGLDSRLLFSYGDGARHNSDQKGKGKH